MRRWLSGPVLAAAWILLCAVFVQITAGWNVVLALPPLAQALIVVAIAVPALVIWAAVAIRGRAVEFAAVSTRLADQLDRLYSPSEERDRRAQEALVALLGKDKISLPRPFAIFVVVIIAVDKYHHVSILLQRSRVAQIGQRGSLIFACLKITVKLAQGDNGNLELH